MTYPAYRSLLIDETRDEIRIPSVTRFSGRFPPFCWEGSRTPVTLTGPVGDAASAESGLSVPPLTIRTDDPRLSAPLGRAVRQALRDRAPRRRV